MRPSIKKILWIAGIVAVLLIAFFVWRATTGPNIPPSENPPGTVPGGGLPIPGATGTPPTGGTGGGGGNTTTTPGEPLSPGEAFRIETLSDSGVQVFGYWVNAATQEAFYLDLNGEVFRAKAGDDEAISIQKFPDLQSLAASPDAQRILISFGSPSAPQWGVFDVIDRAWRPLPDGIRTAAWAGRSDRLIAITETDDGRNISDIDLSKPSAPFRTILSNVGLRDISLAARSATEILITELPARSYPGRAWLLDVSTRSLHLLFQETAGLILTPGGDGQTLFYSASPDAFRILDWRLTDIVPVFFSSLPEKCGVSASTTYCFSPDRYISSKTPTLPDDWLSGAARSVDRLYRVSYAAETANQVFVSGEESVPSIDGYRVTVAGNSLYFMNRNDQSLAVVRFAPTP